MTPCVGSFPYEGPSNTPDYLGNVPASVHCEHINKEYIEAGAYTEHSVILDSIGKMSTTVDFTSVIGTSTETGTKVSSIKGIFKYTYAVRASVVL